MALDEDDYWEVIHAERGRVAHMLEELTGEQWRTRSLCTECSVDQVTAHLTAAANTGIWAWLRSITLAGFNADRHNARRLAQHLGEKPEETLQRFRRSVALKVAPTKDHAAWLGEVIVHGQDIARPLDIALEPDPVALIAVARFFVARNFAVNSRSLTKALSLKASDADFTVGSGPIIRGRLLDLVMAMAGRPDYCTTLGGAGVNELRSRIDRSDND